MSVDKNENHPIIALWTFSLKEVIQSQSQPATCPIRKEPFFWFDRGSFRMLPAQGRSVDPIGAVLKLG